MTSLLHEDSLVVVVVNLFPKLYRLARGAIQIQDGGTDEYSLSTTQHNTTQHNTIQHNTTQHNTTQHNTIQCKAMQCNAKQPQDS